MLTAQEIQNQQFHVRFRGFDVEEVDEFLERAAAALLALSEENQELRERLEAAEREVRDHQSQEKSALSAIVSAQSVAQEMKEKSRQEAQELLAKTREEVQELEENARREIVELEQEVERLKGIKGQVREEMRQVLESYLSLLDRDECESDDSRLNAVCSTAFSAAEPAGAKIVGSELYQRIELSDDLLSPADEDKSPSTPEFAQHGTEDSPIREGREASTATTGVSNDEGGSLPDLDGDMVFTLEDPLEDDEEGAAAAEWEPTVSIADEFATEEDKKK
ncbi:DivIVA domain-containing protein [Desulfurivibrio sp. C05AmB]|uniref:DivIVA domain-containing protein n=1 Tax=Desulfurivibrio sp. C05AmB TaxID=3374371 RepID=UPI00376EF9E7